MHLLRGETECVREMREPETGPDRSESLSFVVQDEQKGWKLA